MKKLTQLSTLLLLFIAFTAHAQNIKIKGSIYSPTLEPIQDVTLILKGTAGKQLQSITNQARVNMNLSL